MLPNINKFVSPNVNNENILHVITVISNACEFETRWKLMDEFIQRMVLTNNIALYIVEMVYNDQEFHTTHNTKYFTQNNISYLQLKCNDILWHKENMINLGIKYLFPCGWKYMAWLDGDIEFLNGDWANETIGKLQSYDILHLFESCFDLDKNKDTMFIHESFGTQWAKGIKTQMALKKQLIKLNHPGYAWACTRKFYDEIGIYDKGIVGHGDRIMALGIIGLASKAYGNVADCINFDIEQYINKYKNIKFGYVSGNILHYFHGFKKNRQYAERYEIIKNNNFTYNQITYDKHGILIWSEYATECIKNSLIEYFKIREEDEQ